MASAVRPRFVPPPFQDTAEQGRLILRDGGTATIRLARPEDAEALRVFFDGLSPESRRRRFFSVAPPVLALITSLPASARTRPSVIFRSRWISQSSRCRETPCSASWTSAPTAGYGRWS